VVELSTGLAGSHRWRFARAHARDAGGTRKENSRVRIVQRGPRPVHGSSWQPSVHRKAYLAAREGAGRADRVFSPNKSRRRNANRKVRSGWIPVIRHPATSVQNSRIVLAALCWISPPAVIFLLNVSRGSEEEGYYYANWAVGCLAFCLSSSAIALSSIAGSPEAMSRGAAAGQPAPFLGQRYEGGVRTTWGAVPTPSAQWRAECRGSRQSD
jgi:hypothetical protein